MVHTVLVVVGVLVVAAVAAGFVLLVLGDLRRSKESLGPTAQRNLEAQRAAERRVNRGAGWSSGQ
jgi:hypothetical protein